MFEGAYLKIDQAAKHVEKLNMLLSEKPPFSYIVVTNEDSGKRFTRAKKDVPIARTCALLIGDAIHNLRCSLDHAYWDIVSQYAINEREKRAVQFPFSETAARLDEAVANRLAKRVSPEFFNFIIDLAPHSEAGGNEMLYFIHQADVVDKHRLLIPTGNYTTIDSVVLQRQIPDFPGMFNNCGFGMSAIDVIWPIPKKPGGRVFEKKLDVPVQVVFQVGSAGRTRPVVPTLYKLIDVTKAIVDDMIQHK